MAMNPQSPNLQSPPASKKLMVAGWIVSLLPVGMLLFSASMKFMKTPEVIEGMKKYGYDERVILFLGIVELTSTILFMIPPTAALGAILLTGYLGGATDTHVRAGEPFIFPIVFGVLVWVGLLLRDARFRAVLPFSK